MGILSKILAKIDGIIDKIPRDIQLQIKRLSAVLLVFIGFIAVYIGYRSGVAASRIPGDPLINVTNDIWRVRLNEKSGAKESLADDDASMETEEPPIFKLRPPLSLSTPLPGEKIHTDTLNVDIDRKENRRPLPPEATGKDPTEKDTTIELAPLDILGPPKQQETRPHDAKLQPENERNKNRRRPSIDIPIDSGDIDNLSANTLIRPPEPVSPAPVSPEPISPEPISPERMDTRQGRSVDSGTKLRTEAHAPKPLQFLLPDLQAP